MRVSSRVISNMLYWIMPIAGQPIAETTAQKFPCDDMLEPDITVYIKSLDQELTESFGNTNFIINDFNEF